MIQQFIDLGQGYGDVYELCELIQTNKIVSTKHLYSLLQRVNKKFASLAVAFKPVGESKFMPIYICREGIPYNEEKPSKRIELFEETLNAIDKTATLLEIKALIYIFRNQIYFINT